MRILMRATSRPGTGSMGGWMHTNDPFAHLVTTSLTGGSDRPEIWTCRNSISPPTIPMASRGRRRGSTPSPNPSYNAMANRRSSMSFGTDWRGWNRTNDLYLAVFRQGLWAARWAARRARRCRVLGDDSKRERLPGLYVAGDGVESDRLGIRHVDEHRVPNGRAHRPRRWAASSRAAARSTSSCSGFRVGRDALGLIGGPNAGAANYSRQPELFRPRHVASGPAGAVPVERLADQLGAAGDASQFRLVVPTLVVKVDGTECIAPNLRTSMVIGAVTNEYNIDLAVTLPSGKRLIEITNAGSDWFYLDWVRLEQVLPPPTPATGSRPPDAMPARSAARRWSMWSRPRRLPRRRDNASLPQQQGQTIVLTSWPGGTFYADWYNPATAARLGLTQTAATNGILTLPLPTFRKTWPRGLSPRRNSPSWETD